MNKKFNSLKWLTIESSIQLGCPEIRKIAQLGMQKNSKITCYVNNVKNPATFVEGLWPEFYARGRPLHGEHFLRQLETAWYEANSTFSSRLLIDLRV